MIEEFYDTVKDKYEISLEECKLICRTPFSMLKDIMNKGLLKDVRFQYLGTFTVSQKRLNYMLEKRKIKNELEQNNTSK